MPLVFAAVTVNLPALLLAKPVSWVGPLLLFATVATLFFVPVFFSIVHGWLERRKKAHAPVRTSIVDEFDEATE